MIVRGIPYQLEAVGLSDVGLVRDNNEDVFASLPDVHLYLLADGMGGHQAGEIAAREAVATFAEHIRDYSQEHPESVPLSQIRNTISDTFVQVNRHIYEMGIDNHDLRGMGTTLCCLYFHEQGLVFGHVGDSRIYRLRGGQLVQITKDHSLLRELLDLGQVSKREAGECNYKHILTRAIGTEPKVEPSVQTEAVENDDIYLICSDGLSDMLTELEIQAILKKSSSVKSAAKRLIDLAKERGGLDNITVLLVSVKNP